jgi:hypothetical protein
MATGTAATTAREYHTDQVHYLSKPIVYTTLAYNLGYAPAGAMIVGGGVGVVTVFAGGVAQTLNIGTSADADEFATALVLTTAGVIPADVLDASNGIYLAADTMITAELSAGTTPTAGAGYVYVSYIMVNRSA